LVIQDRVINAFSESRRRAHSHCVQPPPLQGVSESRWRASFGDGGLGAGDAERGVYGGATGPERQRAATLRARLPQQCVLANRQIKVGSRLLSRRNERPGAMTNHLHCGDAVTQTRESFKMLTWLHRRREAARLAEEAAETLVAADRLRAYSQARQRQRDAHNTETFAHWGRVARAVARLTGKRIGLDTATRMAMEAEPASFADFTASEVGLIAKLRRIVGAGPRAPERGEGE
jgi:hypothetical protein